MKAKRMGRPLSRYPMKRSVVLRFKNNEERERFMNMTTSRSRVSIIMDHGLSLRNLTWLRKLADEFETEPDYLLSSLLHLADRGDTKPSIVIATISDMMAKSIEDK